MKMFIEENLIYSKWILISSLNRKKNPKSLNKKALYCDHLIMLHMKNVWINQWSFKKNIVEKFKQNINTGAQT